MDVLLPPPPPIPDVSYLKQYAQISNFGIQQTDDYKILTEVTENKIFLMSG